VTSTKATQYSVSALDLVISPLLRMPYPEIVIYPTMKADAHSNLDRDLCPEDVRMEMDLCSQLETMSLEKQWGKEKEGRRSTRSAHYVSDSRRPRSHHVRLGRLDLPYRRIGLIKQQRRRAIGMRSPPARPSIHRLGSLYHNGRGLPGSDIHPPIIVRRFSTGSPIMCTMFQ
jgi:hypothetical protein